MKINKIKIPEPSLDEWLETVEKHLEEYEYFSPPKPIFLRLVILSDNSRAKLIRYSL